jgi:hypothetical protein
MSQTHQESNIQALFRTQTANMPRISTSTEKPSYTSLKKFQEAIDENAMSVPSYTTDLGHLALVIPPEDFTSANGGADFIIPSNPGERPTAPDVGGTREGAATALTMLPFTAAENIRVFNQQQQEYIKFRNTRTALKNQILNCVEEKYVSVLKNHRTLFATVTPLQILTHLWTTYGKVDQTDQTANEQRMRAQWNPPSAIETLFEQLEDGQSFASRGDETISDSQLVRWGYENVLQTGLFDRDCAKWRKKTSVDRTWANFKIFFATADDDRSKNTTASEATYTANQVQQLIQQELAAFIQHEQAEKENNQPPPPPPAQEQANAVTAADIQKMIDSAINQSAPPPSNRPLRPRNGRSRQVLKAQALDDGTPVTYCWTHGITSNLRHTSHTCTRKAENHKDEATYDNRMGGSDQRQKARK